MENPLYWSIASIYVLLTLIGMVPGYDSGGFVEIFSTKPFYQSLCILGHDSDGSMEFFSKTRFKHDFLNHATSGVRLRRFCGLTTQKHILFEMSNLLGLLIQESSSRIF